MAITTPFGPDSTAADVIAGVDLTGKRAVITGGASGIGVETARALAAAGARVTLAVRDVEAGRRVAAGLGHGTTAEALDLSDLATVAAFVKAWDGPLHILVNNAGIMATPELRTPGGVELQFATNHLGHFALALGLHDALAATGDARIVSVSSVGHINGEVVFDDINFTKHPYDPWQAYSQSKTANVLFAVEADRLWAADGIRANALTPGRIHTGLTRHIENDGVGTSPTAFQAGNPDIKWKTPQQGAATSTLLAASPLLAGVGGRYFEDCQEASPVVPGIRYGVAPYALDPAKAARLWQVSTDMLAAA